ncbi:MAG TPA: hypothetical protein VJV03_13460 [Pyrinomonadaceae bacterium]|nr:hypothetical protein [Pyrinomonadaceae bacterium]
MDKLEERECAAIGRKIALRCALPTALVFLAVMIYVHIDLYLEQEPQRQNPVAGLLYFGVLAPTILGVLYLASAFLGRIAGRLIYRETAGFAGAYFIGIGWALGCYVSVAAVMFIVFLVSATSKLDMFFVTSLVGLTIGMYVSLPAILLGTLYGFLVRRKCVTISRKG